MPGNRLHGNCFFMDKIPVNIISGFLGSGKTTAILELLNQKSNDEKWAIVINEFGKVSIDSQTIRSSSKTGKIYEIAGGCICCSARGYFFQNLSQIVQTGNYSRIIIEPSGLGGIETVSEVVALIYELKLMPVICLVDMTCIESPRFQLNPVRRAQISKADILIFSKTDLVEDKMERERLTSIFFKQFPEKSANLVQDNTQLANLLDINVPDELRINQYERFSKVNKDLTDSHYKEVNYRFSPDTIFDPDLLSHCFNTSQFIIRGKGYIRTKNGWNLFNFTPSGCSFEPCLEKEQNQIVIIFEESDFDEFENLQKEVGNAIISVHS